MNWRIVTVVFMACMTVGQGWFCSDAGECGEEECCVALTPYQLRSRGICRQLGRAGRPCNEEDAVLDYYGGKFLEKCPCREGLTCLPSSRYREEGANPILKDLSQRCERSTAVPRATTVIPLRETPFGK